MVSASNGLPVLGRYKDVILIELDGPRQRQVDLQWLWPDPQMFKKPSPCRR